MSLAAANTQAVPQDLQKVQNTSNLPCIERLCGRENWHTGNFAVETYLELEVLWGVVVTTVGCLIQARRNYHESASADQ